MTERKLCSRCNTEKTLDNFYLVKYDNWCKQCRSDYYKKNRHIIRKSRYGITEQQYNDMLADQGGTCATCPETTKLQVDHDHTCCPGKRSCGGCVRGILCASCNSTLGLANDDVERLKRLIDYLESAAFE